MDLRDWRSCRRRVAKLELVVGDGEKGTAKRVGVGDGGCRGMDSRLLGSPRLVRAIGWIRILRRESSRVGRVSAQRMPNGQVVGIGQAAEEIAYVSILLGVGYQYGVVDV